MDTHHRDLYIQADCILVKVSRVTLRDDGVEMTEWS